MKLDELCKHWNTLAKTDPYWAILTDSAKKCGKWDIEEFFQSGIENIQEVLNYTTSLNLKIHKGKALDFGCGIGRLTQALAPLFDECTGVDIAPAMIDLAHKLNRYGERCKYHVNTTGDLQQLNSDYFDFIYSCLVLQHIEPRYVKEYLREFIRVVKPGGVIIFQIPSHKVAHKNCSRQSLSSDNCFTERSLPDSGFKAKLTFSESHLLFDAGSLANLKVKVQNMSDVAWPPSAQMGDYEILLGNHWLDSHQQLLLIDDGRTPLPHELKPMEEIELPIKIRVPIEDGQYLLEFDMVQEQVAWFHNKGSETLKIPVKVIKPSSIISLSSNRILSTEQFHSAQCAQDTHAEVLIPVIEMHGIPRDEIIALIEKQHGRVIDIQQDNSAGSDWESYRYCISK